MSNRRSGRLDTSQNYGNQQYIANNNRPNPSSYAARQIRPPGQTENTTATNTSTCALEYLDLCGNDITDVGSNMLCNSFVNNIIQTNNDNNVVKTLVLGSNPGISQNGIAAIEEINKNYD